MPAWSAAATMASQWCALVKLSWPKVLLTLGQSRFRPSVVPLSKKCVIHTRDQFSCATPILGKMLRMSDDGELQATSSPTGKYRRPLLVIKRRGLAGSTRTKPGPVGKPLTVQDAGDKLLNDSGDPFSVMLLTL